jgi:predicted phosphodiesterase
LRTALISDIHGNLLALEAVLRALEEESVDQIIFLGDAYSTGPSPHETLERMKKSSFKSCIVGNHDAITGRPARMFIDNDIKILDEIDDWCSKQLTGSDREYLSSFKPIIETPIGNGRILLAFHGSPRSNREWLFSNASDQKLEEALSGFKADVMAFGHTHIQMLRQFGNTILINPGSVGLPFQAASSFGKAQIAPRADFAILDSSDSGVSLDFKRIPLDSEKVKQNYLSSDMPHAETFFEAWPRRIANLYLKLSSKEQ